MGVQTMPAFSVFQTPPEPAQTYQTLRFLGWMAISLIRPDMRDGPMFRKASPARTSGVRRLFFSALASGFAAGFAAVWTAAGAVRTMVREKQRMSPETMDLFTETSLVRRWEEPEDDGLILRPCAGIDYVPSGRANSS
jgi:hypothetical protein